MSYLSDVRRLAHFMKKHTYSLIEYDSLAPARKNTSYLKALLFSAPYLQRRANVQYQVFQQLQMHFPDFEHFDHVNRLFQVN